MGKGKKRKSNYYSNFNGAKKWKGTLAAGMRGFLCTCNSAIKESIREAYNLLNETSDKLDGPEKIEVPSESIEDDLEKELENMRKEKPDNKKFQVVETGVDNAFFIKTTVKDPKKITDEIFAEAFATKQTRCRYLLRMVPIKTTCKAYIKEISTAADGFFDEYFICDPVTFSIHYKARYHTSSLRDKVLSTLDNLVKQRNTKHKVELSNPQKTIIVEVIKNLCCLSVVDNFMKYRKYNLAEIAKLAAVETQKKTDDGNETAALKSADGSQEESPGDESVKNEDLELVKKPADAAETKPTETTEASDSPIEDAAETKTTESSEVSNSPAGDPVVTTTTKSSEVPDNNCVKT